MKIKGIPLEISASPLFLLLPALLLLTTSCKYDSYDAVPQTGDGMAVELSIMTRAITSSSKTYEVGSQWENYIDIAGGDYKIYFFTNDKDDAAATDDSGRNTLIAEFQPTEMTAVEGSTYTQYTLSGHVGDDIAAYSGFKVVALANWGTYPTVTAGTTTIYALVESESSTFSAETFLSGVDADHLIPFYGVREYSNVEWKEGWRTTLEGDITLLRALAKVEVVMSEDSDIDSFDDVSIVRYNESGYCAPAGVYLKGDYDHGSWEEDFADGVHLVGDRNITSGGSAPLIRQSDPTSDIWTIYIPEYANLSAAGTAAEDYSYLQVNFDGDTDNADTRIYFANYEDGETTSTADYDIFRNCLYRFYVTVAIEEKEVKLTIRVHVEKWEACFDNEYTFDTE
ncbi:MAG: hypothetical protein LUD72_01845 [Bacteroidales bacterium]|nr:hypothetical protein [Bacteroidales bacterium]